ncbi:MAG: RrF2 family transcriptional regulator [Fidelibacterota bacterium]
MLFSKSVEYAVQAMIYLAEKGSPDPIMIGEIAKAYDIPQQFLAKIVQTLVKHRLMIAVRGRRGGVKLARPASDIYLPEVIQAIEGPPPDEEPCIFGLDSCSDQEPCPFHHKWSVIRDEIRHMLDHEDLGKLAKRVTEKHIAMQNILLTEV